MGVGDEEARDGVDLVLELDIRELGTCAQRGGVELEGALRTGGVLVRGFEGALVTGLRCCFQAEYLSSQSSRQGILFAIEYKYENSKKE